MKRILIVAEYFAPNNHIASIRTSKLAKYFKLKGKYHVSVVSRSLRIDEFIDPVLQNDLQYVDEHIIIKDSWIMQKLYHLYYKLAVAKRKKIDKKVHSDAVVGSSTKKIYGFLLNLTRNYVYHSFLFLITKNYAKKAINNIKKKVDNYDIVLTSSGPFSADIIGCAIKKVKPTVLWIADYRDPLKNSFIEKRYHQYYEALINKVAENADIITGISDACTAAFEKYCSEKIHLVHNGFDCDDIKNIHQEKDCKFTLTYAGALYTGKRDISIVFKAIAELIKENKIDENNIIINYLGHDILYLNQQANAHNLINIIKTHGRVNREKSLQLQLSCDILLLASWNNVNDTGVITGKFLEYMMMNKPIICTVTGNLPNSALKEMINNANNGIVWEQANNEIDYLPMKEYILEQYKRYANGLPLDFTPNKEYINRFQYDEIVNKFIGLIEY